MLLGIFLDRAKMYNLNNAIRFAIFLASHKLVNLLGLTLAIL